MFEVFGEVKKHISTSGRYQPEVTSSIFLTMKFGMLVTIMACVLVTAKNYIGDNINCITTDVSGGQELKAIETYCFISSTFSMLDKAEMESPHPGIAPKYPLLKGTVEEYEKALEEEAEEQPERYHSYYQWVPIVLALQAAIYFFPIWLWKQSEKGYFEMVLCGLNNISLDGGELDKIKVSASHFAKTLNHHNNYALKFLVCECIAFALAVGNIFFTDTFLGGEFLNYGPNSLKYLNLPADDPINPLNDIFPKVAKCTWRKFGVSGTIETKDAMCVLPLNIVNEKTYIVLWVAYIAVATITGVVLLIHILQVFVVSFRSALLDFRVKDPEAKNVLRNVLKSSNYGDWFLLKYLQANMAYFPEWIIAVNNLM